jgi:hypothetical protein
MLLDSLLPSRTLSSMKICKIICGCVANHRSRNYSAALAVAGRLPGWCCVPWRPTVFAVGAEDQCAFSPGGNNFLRVTDLEANPLSGRLSGGTKKGSSSRLTPHYSWWSWRGSNSRPLECHSSALPAELQPHTFGFRLRSVHLSYAFDQCQYIFLDIWQGHLNNQRRAGVVKLVDAGDSKSPFPCESVGSIPTSGTKIKTRA